MRCTALPIIGIAIALFGLGGCANGAGSASNAAVCPPLRSYSEDFRKRAVAEMELLPDKSAVEEMLTDYAVLRQQIRACQS